MKCTDPQHYRFWRVGEYHKLQRTDARDQATLALITRMARESLPSAQLVSVERFQNRLMWKQFEHRRGIIALKNRGDANEKLMWHGTSTLEPKAILASEAGLDMRFSQKGFYGEGIYQAERLEYSNGGYSYKLQDGSGNRAVILCRVLAGSVDQHGMDIDRDLKMPRVKASSGLDGVLERHDSVGGGPHRAGNGSSNMIVVYDNAQVYPEFVVTYRPA